MNQFSALRQAMKENAPVNTEYFGLKDDGDKSTVVFLHASEDDIDWGKVYECHLPIEGETNPDGTQKKIKKYVLYKGDNDPLARAGLRTKIRALFQLVEKNADGTYGDMKVWDRGPNHIDQILTFMDTLGPLNQTELTIVRNGKKGSNQTKYQMIPMGVKINPEALGIPKPKRLTETGKYILDLNEAEMQQVAAGTYFLPAFEKNSETVNAPTNAGVFGANQTVQPSMQTPPQPQTPSPGEPVWNPVTQQYELPNMNQPQQPQKEDPSKPPQPILDNGTWHVPVYNNEKQVWEYPTMQKAGIVSGENKPKDPSKMF